MIPVTQSMIINMKHLTIKLRLVLFTGMVVCFTAGVLTLISMYNAQRQISTFRASVNLADADTPGVVTYIAEEPPQAPEETPEQTMKTYEIEADGTKAVSISIADAADNAQKGYNIASITAMLIVAAVSIAGAYFLAGRSLKPIQELSETAADITEHNLNIRLPARCAKDEISSLTNSFNGMLNRLNDAFERQKRFSSNAAHELKTPVAIIQTGVQALQNDSPSLPEDAQETLTVISRNTKRLTSIIDDLLALTNSNALPSETVSLNAMLAGIVRDITPQYQNKAVAVAFHFPKEDCFIHCPEGLAYRLFYNLIENAFKYNRQNGAVTLSIFQTPDGYSVCVQDTGIGIPTEQLPHIWEAFYCADPSRSKKLGGVGLGLAMVQEIAGRIGWQVSVSSIEGVGSRFTVSAT